MHWHEDWQLRTTWGLMEEKPRTWCGVLRLLSHSDVTGVTAQVRLNRADVVVKMKRSVHLLLLGELCWSSADRGGRVNYTVASEGRPRPRSRARPGARRQRKLEIITRWNLPTSSETCGCDWAPICLRIGGHTEQGCCGGGCVEGALPRVNEQF